MTTEKKYHNMITKAYLLHVVDGLVEDVERPVGRGERGEDMDTEHGVNSWKKVLRMMNPHLMLIQNASRRALQALESSAQSFSQVALRMERSHGADPHGHDSGTESGDSQGRRQRWGRSNRTNLPIIQRKDHDHRRDIEQQNWPKYDGNYRGLRG